MQPVQLLADSDCSEVEGQAEIRLLNCRRRRGRDLEEVEIGHIR